jgi:hypothetical protein
VNAIAFHTKRWLAVAALVGLAAPALAQPGSGDDLQMRPAQNRNGAWPEFAPPPDSNSASPIPTRPSELPADVTAPKNPIATTSGNLPSFAGFGRAGGAPQPGSFPQPDTAAPLDPTPAPAPGKVWNVSSNPNAAPTQQPAAGERTPREFGNGWKGVIKGQNHAANLARPRSSGGPRPEWGWHGYDNYNRGRPETTDVASTSAEMAPYMKYAHLWKPAVTAGGYSQPTTGLVESTPIMPMVPATTTSGFEPPARPMGSMTPSVTVPVDASGRPGSPIQTTEYRAPLTPPPAPPVAPEVARPKVMFLPETGGTNRLPLAVREKISEVCTGKCRNLAVTMQTPSRLTVSFLVKDQIEAELLTNMLGSLPELAPYKVDFEVQIGQ